MKELLRFTISLIRETKKDDVMSLAGELTYHLILSLFPLIIFLMSILGFLNLESELLIEQLSNTLPNQIIDLIYLLDREVISQRSVSLLSTSFLFSIYSSSSGFVGIIRGINKSYGNSETRGFIKVRLISIALVFIFAISIAFCIVSIVFRDYILLLISKYLVLPDYALKIYGLISTFVTLAILQATTMIIYKLSNCKKQRLVSVMPGALITVIVWILVSKAFNIYVNNFSRYSIIYGSLGSIIILLIWLNLISIVLLVGSEINALLELSS